MDQYLTDGFETAGDPLFVTQPETLWNQGLVRLWDCPEPLATASLGYMKGMARTNTLLSFLHWCMESHIDLKDVHSKLHRTICKIYVHHQIMDSRMDEALKNMKISCKGSLRKPPNVISIAGMVRSLFEVGMRDFGAFVRKWNAMSGRQHQIIGQRAVSLRLLFETAPPFVVDLIFDHVLLLSWESCAWSEDNMSSQRLHPRYQFPATSKKWLPRLKVTEEASMDPTVRRIQTAFSMTAQVYLRKKTTKADNEALSERGACVWHCGQELQLHSPITDEKLWECWYAPWAEGNEAIDNEIQCMLLDRSDNFQVHLHVQTLKLMLESHSSASPFAASLSGKLTLEVDEFHLLQRQVCHDIMLHDVWQKHVAASTPQFFTRRTIGFWSKSLSVG
jgi:hypothetical protein